MKGGPTTKRRSALYARAVEFADSSRLAKAQRELVGLAADHRIEDVRGARIGGRGVEIAACHEPEACGGEGVDYGLPVDPVQAVGQRRAVPAGAL